VLSEPTLNRSKHIYFLPNEKCYIPEGLKFLHLIHDDYGVDVSTDEEFGAATGKLSSQ
jgi:hypothetical protein